MTLTQRVFTQARLMAHDLPGENQAMLEAACRAAIVSLKRRLWDHLTPDDCLEDFVMAAGMYALAAMSGVSDMKQLEQITAGDLTVRRSGSDIAADCLRTQAEMLMAPYLKAPVAFLGV